MSCLRKKRGQNDLAIISMINIPWIGSPRETKLRLFFDIRKQILSVRNGFPRSCETGCHPTCGKRSHRHRLIHQSTTGLAHRTVFGLIPAMGTNGGPICLVRHGWSPKSWGVGMINTGSCARAFQANPYHVFGKSQIIGNKFAYDRYED